MSGISKATPNGMPEDDLWRDLDRVWWGALVSSGHTYGLIRRTPESGGGRYEVFERRYTMTWRPDREGLARFSGIGGVTDAEPITAKEGERLLAEFIAAGPMGDPDLR
jgi:hypothetical protein